MEKIRVDIEISKETARWAAIEAAKIGLSRRQFLAKCIVDRRYSEPNIKHVKTITNE